MVTVEVQLAVFCVAGDKTLRIVEDVLHEAVDRVLGDVVARQNDRADCDGGDVAVRVVDVGGDDGLGVVVGRCAERFDVRVVEADEIDVLGGSEIRDGGGGRARDDERGVDLAVLDVVDAVAEGLVGRDDVRLGQAVGAEDVNSVEVHAGATGTDGDTLALKVGDRLDRRIGGNNLDLLHIERRDGGEAVDLAAFGEEVRAGVGVSHDVGLAEGEVCIAVLKLEDVRLRAVADETDDVDARVVGRVLRDGGAEGVIGAGLAASDKAEFRALIGCAGRGIGAARTGSKAQNQNQSQQNGDTFFHDISSSSSSCLWISRMGATIHDETAFCKN